MTNHQATPHPGHSTKGDPRLTVAPEPSATLIGELKRLFGALDATEEQFSLLLARLEPLAFLEGPSMVDNEEMLPMPSAVAAVRSARQRVEWLCCRMSELGSRLRVE